eukprot:3936055-Rhodomonas_salina.2
MGKVLKFLLLLASFQTTVFPAPASSNRQAAVLSLTLTPPENACHGYDGAPLRAVRAAVDTEDAGDERARVARGHRDQVCSNGVCVRQRAELGIRAGEPVFAVQRLVQPSVLRLRSDQEAAIRRQANHPDGHAHPLLPLPPRQENPRRAEHAAAAQGPEQASWAVQEPVHVVPARRGHGGEHVAHVPGDQAARRAQEQAG